MRVLLDCSALIELRDPQGDAEIKAAIAAIADDDLFLSALTIGEISKGVARLPNTRKKRALSVWLSTLERQFAHRILSVDIETGRIWGQVAARFTDSGKVLRRFDGLFAATALRHGLHIMTCDGARFEGTGVLIANLGKASTPGD